MVIELRSGEDVKYEVVATHALAPGTCVLIEAPFADVTTMNTCAHCYRRINRQALLSRRRPCLKCHQVMYCTKKCKVAHEEIHEAYCEAFKMGSAHHRKLSKSQEHLAILTAQCISRVFLEAEREGICGVHVLYNAWKDSAAAPSSPSANAGIPPEPDKWLYDYSICKILYLSGLPPIDPNSTDMSMMQQRAGEPELPLDTIGTVKDFLLLTKLPSSSSSNGSPPSSSTLGLSNESLEASLDICNAILRRWLCTCNSKWSDSSADKRQIIENVMLAVLNNGIFTEVHWPNEFISTQMPEILPTTTPPASPSAMMNSSTHPLLKLNPLMKGDGSRHHPQLWHDQIPLDRRDSNIIEEHMMRPCDRYLPSIAGFNTSGSYGLWPRLSLLTHSCTPNCSVYWVKNRAVVVTLRAIPEGERLTVAKCSLLLPYPARTLILKSRYNFNCRCERCLNQGQITLQDIDSVNRDLAPVIPDYSIINGLVTEPLSYLNIDYGLLATKNLQQLYVLEPNSDSQVTTKRQYPGPHGGGGGGGGGGVGTPETIDPSQDDRYLSFSKEREKEREREGQQMMLRLPTIPTLELGQGNQEVLVARCEISLLNNLLTNLRHQTSERSFSALREVTASTLENRLNPLSLNLYQLRQEMVSKDWRAAAKQLVFLSFIYRHCEGSFERIEMLETLGLLLKRDYYNKRLVIGRKRKPAPPAAKVNYAATMSTTAESCSIANNQFNSHQHQNSFGESQGQQQQLQQQTAYLVPLTKEADKEVIAEALRCIFREVQYGYQNLFGKEFARTKQATNIIAELMK